MKIFLLTIITLICLASPVTSEIVEARMSINVCGGSSGATAAAYCTGATACTSTYPGECGLLCEDFEGSSNCDSDNDPDKGATCRNGWVVAADAGGSSTAFNYTTASSLCTGTANTNVLRVIADGTNTASAIFDSGGARPISYTQAYFLLESENMTVGSSQAFLWGCNTSNCSQVTWRLMAKDSDGTLVSTNLYYYNASGSFTTLTGTTTFPKNEWHRLVVKHDYTNGAIEWWVDGTSQGTASDPGNRGSQYLAVRTAGGYALTYQIDNIAFDADGIQGACQ